MSAIMLVQDWVDLLEGRKEELRKQDWGMRTSLWNGERFYGLRNKEDRCPLCALANLEDSNVTYHGAWAWALMHAFNVSAVQAHAARPIALVADYRLFVKEDLRPLYKQLCEILGAK